MCSERRLRALGEMNERRGEKAWFEGALLLSRLHAYPTNYLLLYWKKSEKEPWWWWLWLWLWWLVTKLSGSRQALLAYKRRMWIEQMFWRT